MSDKDKHIKIKNYNSLDNLFKTFPKRTEVEDVSEMINESRNALNENSQMKASVSSSDKYKIYRDKDEVVEFKIGVTGVTLTQASARITLDADPWNVVFHGKIYSDGRCVIPLRKMTLYPEGTTGKITLEVILDGQLFTPWEETFIVEGHKKVNVELVKNEPKNDVK